MATHVFPNLQQNLGNAGLDLATDTLGVLLVASGTYTWNATAQAQSFVSDFLAGSGGGALTEVSLVGTNYTRQNLASVTVATTALVTTLSCASVIWANASFSASYACWFDNATGSDTTRILIAYTDFGGSASASAVPFELAVGSSGVAQWASS